jgi:hypothetical protein
MRSAGSMSPGAMRRKRAMRQPVCADGIDASIIKK